MDTITIIDTFHYPPHAPEVFRQQINRMKELASAYNFSEQPMKLIFLGDQQSGVRFRIDTSDPLAKSTVERALRQFLSQSQFNLN